MKCRSFWVTLFAACGALSVLSAQDATPTNNVLTRTLLVESRYFRGTAFSVDVDRREYWITAKHILTGAKHPPYGYAGRTSVVLKLLNPTVPKESWVTVEFAVIDPGKDVDIVALAPQKPVLENPLPSVPADSGGLLLGGSCEFLGFPYGSGWEAIFDAGGSRATLFMPFIKHCTVSALPNLDPKVWVLDGINNEGFSGGLVVFRTGQEQKIFAVISGYRLEPTEVISSASLRGTPTTPTIGRRRLGVPAKSTVNLNSGFIFAYDIAPAIEAIRKRPIGPLRP